MTDKEVDQEVEAIRTISAALHPLDEAAKQRVMDYVIKRYSLSASASLNLSPLPAIAKSAQDYLAESSFSQISHIRQLKDLKKPKTAIEMAALVAYFLSDLSPEAERKQTVTTKDIETYFKIAGYRLPTALQQLLGNAKNAGYFDLVGVGEYKLNAVGYNLVVHNLPRGEGGIPLVQRRPRRNNGSKKSRARSK